MRRATGTMQIDVNVMMPEGAEKARKSTETHGWLSRVFRRMVKCLEDAGEPPCPFESGKCMIDVVGGMFGGDGHADSARLLRDGGGTDRRGIDPGGQQLFRKFQGDLCASDDNGNDGTFTGGQLEASADESAKEMLAIRPQACAPFWLAPEDVQRGDNCRSRCRWRSRGKQK